MIWATGAIVDGEQGRPPQRGFLRQDLGEESGCTGEPRNMAIVCRE